MPTGPVGKFRIRPARLSDAATLLALTRELAEYERLSHRMMATEESIRRTLFGPRRFAEALIGTLGGKPVGYAVYHPTFSTFAGKPRMYLEDIYIREEHRGKGFGAVMLRQVCRIARKRGCIAVAWAVLDWNEPALQFYRGLGAEPVEEWVSFQLSGGALRKLAGAPQRVQHGGREHGSGLKVRRF